jgi:kinetochore protein Spc24
MISIIDPEEDYLNILAAEEQIAINEAKRKKELEDVHSQLKGALSHIVG